MASLDRTFFPAGINNSYTENASVATRMIRKQTSRACDRCRMRRVRCDNTRPCLQCRERGVCCTNSKGNENPKSLPQALREIERLRLRVADLESELAESTKLPSQNTPLILPSPTYTPASSDDIGNPPELRRRPQRRHKYRGWVGTYAASPRSDYYGTSSAFYFLRRIGSYLGAMIDQSLADRHISPQGVKWKELVPLTVQGLVENSIPTTVHEPMMSRAQEEQFIQQFWDMHYCLLPIINDLDFARHYNSLWEADGSYRKQCPLADIIVALAMQHSWVFLTNGSTDTAAVQDPTIAGRWYFHRCQSLIAGDLEYPTLTTVQCKMLSYLYLCIASFCNTAHMYLGQATRMAQTLGLHLEPPEDTSPEHADIRKRVWICLCIMERRMSMKLGRPCAIDDFDTTSTFPAENVKSGVLSSAGASSPDITWMTYTFQLESLIRTAKEAHEKLQESSDEILNQRGTKGSIYNDPEAVEAYARAILEQVPYMQAWVKQLPSSLKIQRRGHDEPFSVNRSRLDIDVATPLWLQRQRISLELIYHSEMVNLLRPCIVFSPMYASVLHSLVTKQNAVAALNHAIAYTNHMHQMVLETDVMNGWQEHLTWQWNATITAIGYIFANPVDPSTPAASKALDMGIDVFETFANSYIMAANAAAAAKDLKTKAILLKSRFLAGIESGISDPSSVDLNLEISEHMRSPGYIDNMEAPQPDSSQFLGQFMDWAQMVDSYNSSEQFFDFPN